MARHRGVPVDTSARALTGGPGKLCQVFGMTKEHYDGLSLISRRSPLQILDDGEHPQGIEVTPRIGISKAVDRPLRFVAKDLE